VGGWAKRETRENIANLTQREQAERGARLILHALMMEREERTKVT
jgi:hypothetical protein